MPTSAHDFADEWRTGVNTADVSMWWVIYVRITHSSMLLIHCIIIFVWLASVTSHWYGPFDNLSGGADCSQDVDGDTTVTACSLSEGLTAGCCSHVWNILQNKQGRYTIFMWRLCLGSRWLMAMLLDYPALCLAAGLQGGCLLQSDRGHPAC